MLVREQIHASLVRGKWETGVSAGDRIGDAPPGLGMMGVPGGPPPPGGP